MTLNKFIGKKNTPTWIVFLIDVVICFLVLILAYQVRFNFKIPIIESNTFYYVFPFVLLTRALFFYLLKIHTGIIRYTSTRDAQRIFSAVMLGSFVFVAANLIRYWFFDSMFVVPFSIIIIEFLASVFFLISLRISIKLLYFELLNSSKVRIRVAIFGAGDSGLIAKRSIERDPTSNQKVIVFFDDKNYKIGKKLESVSIVDAKLMSDYFAENKVEKLIIAVQNLGVDKKAQVVDICLKNGVDVMNVPPVSDWINGELTYKQITNIKIEDLLGREQIKLNEEDISKKLKNKIVLVSGAAGSIGSELSRQIVRFNPKKLLLLDQSETALYNIENELIDKYGKKNIEVVIGNIRNENRLRALFKTFKPEIVFHAAAYKHVPLMENNPSEAISTNIFGTKNLVDLSLEFEVEKFVMVSTDKAVNPTNVMGASKRIAEMYAQSMQGKGKTAFITTRFGNVLGSAGSVIPLFRKQIENGGPITVTHPDITRFFMTIPEACQLILEAGNMGKGGEIFIFDMGEAVKIVELAKKMIRLSGLMPEQDIKIKYIGLRPGEKLYEELLIESESSIATHHPKIMIAKHSNTNSFDLADKLHFMQENLQSLNNAELVKWMKSVVPEFESNNTIYNSTNILNN
jgi:FlaA1/EpsC-like NDP-sugar epimerase